MRNGEMAKLDGMVGRWAVTMSDAWFLEPPGAEAEGTATVEWLDEAFLVLRSDVAGGGPQTMTFGRSDPQDAYYVLYHDDRGVCRLFDMTFDGRRWTLSREDSDMHQRWVGEVEPDRITGRWEASDDQGQTWRKDFDLTFVRQAGVTDQAGWPCR